MDIKKISYVFILTLSLSLLFISHIAKAVSRELTGYAWAGNVDDTGNKSIGWISFNCSNTLSCGKITYKVLMDDQTGNLSGHAWSSNIGWISFSETSGCPSGSGPCQPKVDLSGGGVSGWLRACSATATKNCQGALASDQSWDGWIRLSGTDHLSPTSSGLGGVTYNTSTGGFSGYAWGDEIMGWVKFNTGTRGVTVPPNNNTPRCTISAVVAGQADINLTWTITNDSGQLYRIARNGSQLGLERRASDPNNYVDSNRPLGPYSYSMSRVFDSANGAVCTSNTVTVAAPPTGEKVQLWLGGISNVNNVEAAIDINDPDSYVDVRWSIPAGVTCVGRQDSGDNISQWIVMRRTSSPPSVERLREFAAVEDAYVLGLDCTDGSSANVPVNTVKIIVTDGDFEEL